MSNGLENDNYKTNPEITVLKNKFRIDIHPENQKRLDNFKSSNDDKLNNKSLKNKKQME